MQPGKRDLRSYKAQLLEAEVLAMPPGEVVHFLKSRANRPDNELRTDVFDAEAESALMLLGHQQIDLALARYGLHVDVTARLFHRAEAGSPVRLACLSNRTRSLDIIPSFPMSIFGDEQQTVSWMLSASDAELCALLENPALSDQFLRDLLDRKAPFDQIDFDRLCGFVMALHRNERMQTPYNDEVMDGFAEYSHGSVFDAAWSLAEIAPVTQAWAQSLGYLYEKLLPHCFSIEDPLAMAERWSDEVLDKGRSATEASLPGWLSDMQSVRRGLAGLVLRKDPSRLSELLNHSDVAFRCAAYSKGSLSADQMHAGYERDGELMFNESLHNLLLWRTAEKRRAVHDIAWSVVRADRHSDLLAGNQFNGMESFLREKHPDWFLDEDQDLEDPQEAQARLPATKSDVAALAERMDQQTMAAAGHGLLLQKVISRSGWIFWFSLGALVMALAKH